MSVDPKHFLDLISTVDKMNKRSGDLEARIIALEIFAGFLLHEVAKTKSDPRVYLRDNASPAFLGFAEMMSHISTSTFTQTIERVLGYAEKLPLPGDPIAAKPSKPRAKKG